MEERKQDTDDFFPRDHKKILQSSPIFSELSEADIADILQWVSVIKIAGGKNLYCQGDQSDGAYIVVSGKLALLSRSTSEKERVIDYILPNEIVGEMALISEGPRPITVRAKMDTILLKLESYDFYTYSREKPEVLFKIMDVIIRRAQNIFKSFEKGQHYQYIALLPVHENIPSDHFLELLEQANSIKPKGIIVLRRQEIERHRENITSFFSELRSQYRFVIYSVDLRDPVFAEQLIQYADKVLILAEGNSEAVWHPLCELSFKESKDKYYMNHELILFYPNREKRPLNTRLWLAKGSFSRYHHISAMRMEDFKRLIRFITGTAVGLVLGGGGSRGWAHLGVIKALSEAGLQFDAISGTSVGATVAAVYLTNPDFNTFYSKMYRLAMAAKKSYSFSHLVIPVISLYNMTPIGTAILEEFATQYIEDLVIPFFCQSYRIDLEKEVVHWSGLLWKCLAASGSLPGLAPPVLFNGHPHVDGGVVNNLPVDTMRQLFEGKGTIVAVSLISDLRREEGHYNYPLRWSFLKSLFFKIGVTKNRYHLPGYFDILVRGLLAGSASLQRKNAKDTDILIQPNLEQFRMIDKATNMEKMFEIGYREACNMLESCRDKIQEILKDLS